MGYQGNYPPSTPLNPTQLGTGVVTSDAIANGAVVPADLSTGGPYWNTSGNVGIGTTSPGANNKLDVREGNIALTKTSGSPVSYILSNQAAGYSPPQFQLVRYGAGATATPDNSTIGEIRFDGLNAAGTYDNMGMIQVTSGVNAAGGAPSVMIFSTASSGSAATERMRIDSSGNVGIGTSSPAVKLDVRGSSSYLINATNPTAWVSVDSALTTGSMYNQWNTTSNVGISGTYTNNAYLLVTNNTERMRIDTSGNAFIGATAATWDERLGVRPSGVGTVGIGVYSSSASYTGSLFRAQAENATGANFKLYEGRGSGGGVNYWVDGAGGAYFAGNVGIGISSPARKLDVSGGARFVQDAAATTGAIVLRQNSGDTVGGFIQWVNNANAAEKGWMTVDTSSNMLFATVSSERMRIDSSGNLLVGTASATANGGVIQVSNGITFPATQSAASNANTLDDYEEGTWTPSGATGFPAGGAPSAITATYTKIGNMVSVRATFTGYNDGTSLYISGLPFTVSGDSAAKLSNSTPNSFTYERVSGAGFYCTISGTNATNKTWYLEATYRA